MILAADPDCNQTDLSVAGNADLTYRCKGPEGHAVHGPWELMFHKHRAPVQAVTTPFGPSGGKHRRIVGAGSGPNRVDSELRRRLAQARA